MLYDFTPSEIGVLTAAVVSYKEDCKDFINRYTEICKCESDLNKRDRLKKIIEDTHDGLKLLDNILSKIEWED